MDLTRGKRVSGLRLKRPRHRAHVSRDMSRRKGSRRDFDRAIKIAAQGFDQLCAIGCGQGPVISLLATVKRPRHGLDPPADAQIADPKFAQAPIHIREHVLEQALTKRAPGRTFSFETAQKRSDMQGDHLEPAIKAIGHGIIQIENRIAGLIDRGPIERPRRRRQIALARPEAAAEQVDKHAHGGKVDMLEARVPVSPLFRDWRLYKLMRDMATTRRLRLAGALILAPTTILFAGCAARLDTHGFMPNPERIEQVEVGKIDKLGVADVLGSPSTISTFDSQTWYYIHQKTKNFAFFRPEIVEQSVLVVAFDDQDLVSDLRRYTLEDGLIVDPVSRKTPTAGKELTFIQQLFGNVGRFTKE